VLPTLQQHSCKQRHQHPFPIFTFSLATMILVSKHIAFKTANVITLMAMCAVCSVQSVTYWAITISSYLALYRFHRFSSSSFIISFCCFTSSCYCQYSSIYLSLLQLPSVWSSRFIFSSSSLLPVHHLLYQPPFSTPSHNLTVPL
jgi:hypothetical protein